LTASKEILRDIVRAVAVLSLFLFALTQAYPTAAVAQTASSAASLNYVASVLSASAFCGGGDDHGDQSHSGCHVCRTGAVALPPPPATAQRAFAPAAAVAYAAAPLPPVFSPHRAFAPARAPPAA
jgi:hypothetical protein